MGIENLADSISSGKVADPIDIVVADLAEAEARFEALFRGGIEALFEKHKELVSLVIVGYTPAWDDGSPCYHSSSWMFNAPIEGEVFNDDYNIPVPEDLLDHLQSEGDVFCSDTPCKLKEKGVDEDQVFCQFCSKKLEANTSVKDGRDISAEDQEALQIDAGKLFEGNTLERVYGTNWSLVFYRGDGGEIVEHRNDFDCGY